MIGKTLGDIVSGRFTEAWNSLSPEGKAACVVGGMIATAQFAMMMVFGKGKRTDKSHLYTLFYGYV